MTPDLTPAPALPRSDVAQGWVGGIPFSVKFGESAVVQTPRGQIEVSVTKAGGISARFVGEPKALDNEKRRLSERQLTVSQLIAQLQRLPGEALVRYVWDGASLTGAEIAYIAKSGDVLISADRESTSYEEDHPADPSVAIIDEYMNLRILPVVDDD